MKFGELPLAELEGALLGHTHLLPAVAPSESGVVLSKGRKVGPEERALLEQAGVRRAFAAVLEPGDVVEDDAAARLAAAALGNGVRFEPPSTGRVHLFARHRGVFVTEPWRVDAVNLVDARLTLATIPPFRVVEPDELVATIEVIPLAVPASALSTALAAAERAGPILEVRPFTRKRVALILTELPGLSIQHLTRAEETQAARIEHVGAELSMRLRIPHETPALAAGIERALAEGASLVLILGASAVVDPADVVPAAIERSGGVLVHFGMPVDPGNLLVLGRRGDVPIVGVPGCARSPKRSGFDTVLERLAADIPVRSEDIQRMGAGGLLAEVPSRPRPRQEAPRAPRSRVAGVVLAAGRSTRMGERNKLLERLEGVPMVARVVDALIGTRLDPVVVVVGHEGDQVRRALRGRPIKIAVNARYAEGLASSLEAGLSALDDEVDGALVALGDMPLVASRHVEALLDAFDSSGAGICVPVAGGRRGNPVLFRARYFDEMTRLEGDSGARGLFSKYPEAVREVPLDDDAVLVDVDTPEALAALATRSDLEPSAPFSDAAADAESPRRVKP